MVLDFSFVKEEMEASIGQVDHGLLACVDDKALLSMLGPRDGDGEREGLWLREIRTGVARDGYYLTRDAHIGGSLYVMAEPPTAEVLAQHWFGRLVGPIERRGEGSLRLSAITVWETPNCWARYGDA